MLDLFSSASTQRRKNLKYVAFPGQKETVFEKKPGVHSVEIQSGFSQVCIDGFVHILIQERLLILKLLKQHNINIDFLKLTLDGLTFTIKDQDTHQLEKALQKTTFNWSIISHRSILTVCAVNLRDEEGLIAEILAMAIGLGIEIDHVGDTHDKLLLVSSSDQVSLLAQKIQEELIFV